MVEKQRLPDPLGALRLDRPSQALEGFRRFVITTSGEIRSDPIRSGYLCSAANSAPGQTLVSLRTPVKPLRQGLTGVLICRGKTVYPPL